MMEHRLKPFFAVSLWSILWLSGCSHWEQQAENKPSTEPPERVIITDDGGLTFATTQLDDNNDDNMLLELKLQLQGPPDPHWVHESRHYLGKVVGEMTDSIDTFIADDASQVDNDSYLRLRLSQTWQDGGNMIGKSNVRFYADLPKAKNSIGVVFDSAPEEFESLEEQNRESASGDQQLGDADTATAAIRFALNVWAQWTPKLDVGIQGGLPINPFIRFRFDRAFDMTDYWQAISQNALYYYYQNGGVQQSSLSFVRPIQESLLFINKWEARWGYKAGSLSFANINSLTHAYDDRRVFTYRLGAFYEQRPDPLLTSYFVDFTYRQRLHEDWLYAELIPSISWVEETSYEAVAELTLRFEMFFRN